MIWDAWLAWLVPLAGALFIPLVERVRRSWCRWFAIGAVAATMGVSVHLAATFATPQVDSLGGWSVYGGMLAEVYVDGLSVLLALFVSALSLVIIVYAAGNMKHESGQGRFYFLILAFVGAMMGLVLAGNLVQFYLLWEVLGICSALLIAFWWDREPARKAGLKAFLVTRVGDVALLIAVVMIFANLHTADIRSVLASVSSSQGGVSWSLVGVLLLVGAMGKSAQVPFHVWLPDAMEGPTPVSALIHAATMVNAGVYLLVRMAPVFATSPWLSDTVLGVGLLSLVVGGACASAATDIKRVLAYSTISQLGLMFAAVGVGSLAGAIYQLVGQGVFKALAFMSAGSVSEAAGTRDIQGLGGLARKMRYTYAGFLVSALAMAGFPPFFGFWTKEYIASFALSSGAWVFLVLLAGSALTTFYMFRVLFRVFHGKESHPEAKESGGLMVGPMVLLSLVSAIGWLAVSYQSLYSPVLGTGLDPYTAVSSVAVVSGVLYVAYLAFVKPRLVDSWMKQGGALWRTAAVLREGVWFDAAYSYFVREVFYPASSAAVRIQSGDLGKNVALLLGALVATILIVAWVVA